MACTECDKNYNIHWITSRFVFGLLMLNVCFLARKQTSFQMSYLEQTFISFIRSAEWLSKYFRCFAKSTFLLSLGQVIDFWKLKLEYLYITVNLGIFESKGSLISPFCTPSGVQGSIAKNLKKELSLIFIELGCCG